MSVLNGGTLNESDVVEVEEVEEDSTGSQSAG
jgi:hypothetical protein